MHKHSRIVFLVCWSYALPPVSTLFGSGAETQKERGPLLPRASPVRLGSWHSDINTGVASIRCVLITSRMETVPVSRNRHSEVGIAAMMQPIKCCCGSVHPLKCQLESCLGAPLSSQLSSNAAGKPEGDDRGTLSLHPQGRPRRSFWLQSGTALTVQGIWGVNQRSKIPPPISPFPSLLRCL